MSRSRTGVTRSSSSGSTTSILDTILTSTYTQLLSTASWLRSAEYFGRRSSSAERRFRSTSTVIQLSRRSIRGKDCTRNSTSARKRTASKATRNTSPRLIGRGISRSTRTVSGVGRTGRFRCSYGFSLRRPFSRRMLRSLLIKSH